MRRLATTIGVALAALTASNARADGPVGTTAVRTQAEVYERNKTSLKDILVHVAKDLAVRAAQWPAKGAAAAGLPGGAGAGGASSAGSASVGATLVLVVDPTRSMGDELSEMHDCLVDVAAAGPKGMDVGVLGAAAEWTAPTDALTAGGALLALRAVPFDGPKNLLEAVREAARYLRAPADRPRAIVLVSEEGGDGEDDVEETRDLLRERGCAFYAVAREAAFERPWEYDFKPLTVPDLELTQRFHPMPRKRTKGDLYYGGEVAFGLVPYQWELRAFPLAQTTFRWEGGSKEFPVPSGFGYWPLASLAWSSEGRLFVYNFRAPGARTKADDKNVISYDFGFLNLFAPDLRPRAEIVKALEQDRRALAVVRIWEHLAEDQYPIVLDHGTLEKTGERSLSPRPMLPVQSTGDVPPVYEKPEDLVRAKEYAAGRLKRVEQALSWWGDERAKDRPLQHPDEPIHRRVEADFDLLGFQLLKVRFHWREVVFALDGLSAFDLDGHHRSHLEPVPLALGQNLIPERFGGPGSVVDLHDRTRTAMFDDLFAAARTIVAQYHDTPWAWMVDRGIICSFRGKTDEVRPPPIAPPGPPPDPGMGDGDGGKGGKKPPPPPRPMPPPPPPAGERPGSGSGSSTTGGGK